MNLLSLNLELSSAFESTRRVNSLIELQLFQRKPIILNGLYEETMLTSRKFEVTIDNILKKQISLKGFFSS